MVDFNNENSRITIIWLKTNENTIKKKFNRFKVKGIVKKTDTIRANKMATGEEIVPIVIRVLCLSIFVNGIE